MDVDSPPPLFERASLVRGVVVTLVLAVPTVVAVRAAKGGDLSGAESNLWLYAVGIVLVAYAVGGFVAAMRCLDLPLSHSALGAAIAFVLMAVGSGVAAVADGNHIHAGVVLGGVLLGALCVSAAVLGGYGSVWWAERARRRRGPSSAGSAGG
ncbi:MAG TPA: hypothetical protein VGR90_01725 [Acidimicrobiales bacterium]|nr:hypothetical protein [Acidimicrobiales bacterium]